MFLGEKGYAAIGRLTTTWALVELGLDSLVGTLFHHCGNPCGATELPRSLARQINYLRRSTGFIDFPNYSTAEFRNLLNDVSQTSVKRHDVIHGIAMDYVDSSGHTVFVRKLSGKRLGARKRVVMTISQIDQLTIEVRFLAVRLLAMGVLFYGAKTGDYPEEDYGLTHHELGTKA